jgi:hypothetical protein
MCVRAIALPNSCVPDVCHLGGLLLVLRHRSEPLPYQVSQ